MGGCDDKVACDDGTTTEMGIKRAKRDHPWDGVGRGLPASNNALPLIPVREGALAHVAGATTRICNIFMQDCIHATITSSATCLCKIEFMLALHHL